MLAWIQLHCTTNPLERRGRPREPAPPNSCCIPERAKNTRIQSSEVLSSERQGFIQMKLKANMIWLPSLELSNLSPGQEPAFKTNRMPPLGWRGWRVVWARLGRRWGVCCPSTLVDFDPEHRDTEVPAPISLFSQLGSISKENNNNTLVCVWHNPSAHDGKHDASQKSTVCEMCIYGSKMCHNTKKGEGIKQTMLLMQFSKDQFITITSFPASEKVLVIGTLSKRK